MREIIDLKVLHNFRFTFTTSQVLGLARVPNNQLSKPLVADASRLWPRISSVTMPDRNAGSLAPKLPGSVAPLAIEPAPA